MPRNTKIVATLGPACSAPAVLPRMLAAGVDVVRLNFSHGTASDHIERARARARMRAEGSAAKSRVMADLQGPKIRVGKFAAGKVELTPGQTFVLDAECELGDDKRVGLDYKELPRDVGPGAVLLLNDGLIRLHVEAVDGPRIVTRVVLGGTLSNNKGINRMGGGLTAPALTAKDMEDVKTAALLEADYLAVSFPKNKEDMYMARQLLRAAGGRALLIAKIERAEAITCLEEIIDASDGIMVARGDLAVEVGNAVGARTAEADDQARARAQQAHDHRHADDGVDDPRAGADARGSVRRRQRGARRHRRRDAVGGNRGGQVSGRDRRDDGADLRGGGEVRHRRARPRLPRTARSRASTSRSRWPRCSPRSTSR